MFIKKVLIIIYIASLLTGCNNNIEKIKKENYPNYYKKEYKERYQIYKEKNNDLGYEDIVTRVNIGLDQPYYTNTKETNNLNKTYILVNKYLFMSTNYIPDNLETINQKYTNGTKQLVNEAKIKFEEMAKKAMTDGYIIRAISAYRSYEYQNILYNKYVNQDGIDVADTYSARPGYSEHQTGLAVDIDNSKTDYTKFEETNEFNWMQENAHKYGFILRYPKGKENITGYTYESWHYRYVGEKIATYIKENNITFDEYYIRFIDV